MVASKQPHRSVRLYVCGGPAWLIIYRASIESNLWRGAWNQLVSWPLCLNANAKEVKRVRSCALPIA